MAARGAVRVVHEPDGKWWVYWRSALYDVPNAVRAAHFTTADAARRFAQRVRHDIRNARGGAARTRAEGRGPVGAAATLRNLARRHGVVVRWDERNGAYYYRFRGDSRHAMWFLLGRYAEAVAALRRKDLLWYQ